MGMSKILLIVLLVLVILGSFFSIYKDITSSSNIKKTQLDVAGFAVVGVDILQNNENLQIGVKPNE